MAKRIIVCSDGTWNTPDQKEGDRYVATNVVKMARAIAPQTPDGTAQVIFYDQGVGTNPGIDRWTGGAFGLGLAKNIMDAYGFILNNYADGDEIYLFGYSRGAYTVRSTAGLIRKCGLLHKVHAAKISDALELYRQRDPTPDTAQALAFRENYAREIRIKFIGVWDTVGALGIPVNGLRRLTAHRHAFHNVQLSSRIEYAYHALAIDETRGAYRPALWETRTAPKQTVEQVWFAGVHSDVGGGSEDTGLSDLTFSWMKKKAEATGLAFAPNYIQARVTSDPMGAINRAGGWFSWLTGRYIREIGQLPGGEEAVHQSAYDRYENDPDYAPPNLVDYLNRHEPAVRRAGLP